MGSRRCNCNALPYCLGALGSATPTIHCLTTGGQWAVQLQCTASLPRGRGQWDSYKTLPHCLGAVGSETPAIHCFTTRGVGCAPPTMHCRTTWGQWAVQLLQYTASLPRGSGQCNSCNTLPYFLEAGDSESPAIHCFTTRGVGSATPAMHCLTAWGGGSPTSATRCVTAR